MSEQKATFTLSTLAAVAAERRRRFVHKDAVIAELLCRPVRSPGADPGPSAIVGQAPRSGLLREGARLDLAGGLRDALGEGWHPPDGEWGAWSSGLRAELFLDLDPAVVLPAVIRLELACLMPTKGDQRLTISSPLRQLAELELHQNQDPVSIELPIDALDLSDRRLHLFIEIDGLVFAGSLPGSRDTRWLGVALKALSLIAPA